MQGPEERAESPPAPLEITADMLAGPDVLADGPPGLPQFEAGMRVLPPASIALAVAMGGVFVAQLVGGAFDSPEALAAWGAMLRAKLLAGQLWRLVSATLLHGGLDHFLGNAAMLVVLGMGCEHAFGWKRMLALFWASAAAGWILSAACSPGPSVGASGAIFGLAGALIVFFRRERAVLAVRDKRVGGVLGVWAVYTIVLGFLSPFIDNFAHIGGLLAGGAMAAKLRSPLVERLTHRP